MRSFARVLVIVLLIPLLAACNFPGAPATSSPSVEDQAATVVAATLNAQPTVKPTTAVTPFVSPAGPTAAPITPTVKPTLKINNAGTECRTGPGDNATVVATFDAGTTVNLAGKDNANSFWVVVDPASHTLCWVLGADGTPGGSYQTVAEVTPPAGTVNNNAKVPARPTFVKYAFECSFGTNGQQVNVDLSWPDTADNETGYRIYRDGVQIADLSANTTTYSDTTSATSGHVFVYGVAAYNDTGTSDQTRTGGGDAISC